MTRRALLASLAAAFVLDPERLLWKPGAKLISIPNIVPNFYGPPLNSGVAIMHAYARYSDIWPNIELYPIPRPGDRLRLMDEDGAVRYIEFIHDPKSRVAAKFIPA